MGQESPITLPELVNSRLSPPNWEGDFKAPYFFWNNKHVPSPESAADHIIDMIRYRSPSRPKIDDLAEKAVQENVIPLDKDPDWGSLRDGLVDSIKVREFAKAVLDRATARYQKGAMETEIGFFLAPQSNFDPKHLENLRRLAVSKYKFFSDEEFDKQVSPIIAIAGEAGKMEVGSAASESYLVGLRFVHHIRGDFFDKVVPLLIDKIATRGMVGSKAHE